MLDIGTAGEIARRRLISSIARSKSAGVRTTVDCRRINVDCESESEMAMMNKHLLKLLRGLQSVISCRYHGREAGGCKLVAGQNCVVAEMGRDGALSRYEEEHIGLERLVLNAFWIG